MNGRTAIEGFSASADGDAEPAEAGCAGAACGTVVPAIAEAGSPYGRQSVEVICQVVADFVLSAAPVAAAR